MPKPNLRAVDNEQQHPLDIARQRIAEWRSNAEKDKLPVSNVHDDKGAPLLDIDAVLRRSDPHHVQK